MTRRLDPGTNKFLADLANINRRVERAQREVSSGRRINTVSDAPDQISNLLQIRTELGQTEQIGYNLSRVKSEVDAAEQALQSAVEVLERAGVLGMQGANGTLSPEQRLMIANEVETLLEQMVGLTTTTVEARHIFSGDADNQAPFTLDLSLDDPVSNYLGADATRETIHPTGSRFAISKTGEEIFDNPDPEKNVLEAINNLRLALRDNDEDGIVAALEQIRSAQVHLSGELAFYGAAQNQVAEAINFTHKQELRLKTRLSEIEDADMTDAIVSLNQARYQQEIALSVQSNMPKISLFDFMK